MKKDGMILWSLFITLCLITLSQTPSFSQDESSILFNWKDWVKCSEQERDSLRSRWTDEKIKIVVSALKTRIQLPNFVNNISSSNSSAGYDLRGIQLVGQNLDSVVLIYAYLDGANLINSRFIDAVFDSTSLEEAHLERANLQGATLWYANLQGANLERTSLRGAKLWHSNLQGAILRHTNLKEADLFEARFDTTDLWLTSLGEAQNIRDIVWGDSLHNRYFIYGEMKGDSEHIAKEREKTFRRAENTYRDLKVIYRKEGMDDIANEFHFRENEVHNKRIQWVPRFLRIILLKWTYGYGSKPIWLLRDSLYVVCGFMVFFILLTLNPKCLYRIFRIYRVQGNIKVILAWRKRKLWLLWDCFILSLLCLSTFGYGALQLKHLWEFFHLEPIEYKPIRLARILVGIEAGLGILLFAFLVKWLFGRG